MQGVPGRRRLPGRGLVAGAGADVALPAFGAPGRSLRLVIPVAALGYPQVDALVRQRVEAEIDKARTAGLLDR